MSCLWTRVAAIARAQPERLALVDGPRRVSYGALWSEVLRFAAAVGSCGLARGDRVAVVLANGVEAVVACYGTWVAGGVVVPLNVQARARELGPWLAHSGARFVVHASEHADVDDALSLLDAPPVRIVWTSKCEELGEPLPPAGEEPPISGELAVVLYTSGTTGRPKGVMLSHDNLVANVDAIVGYLGLSDADSIVTVLPFYYSYGASVLHTHLAVGAHLVLEPSLVFPHRVIEAVARERVTGFSGVPSTFALLLARVELSRYDLSSLRYLTQAGGPMAPSLIERVRAALPRARLFVMYGQTEATARLTWLPPERLEEKLGSVGVPIAGVRLEVRRDTGERAAPGEEGAVWVSGPSVMLGFLDDPLATAAVLRDGWLETGDVGHLDEEGFLYLSGRRTDMIKTGAHRVHPSDVEAVIAEVDGITEVAVTGSEDALLGQVVKAFVVVDGPFLPERIKAHCRERLAAYKVPKQIEQVRSLPKTASGKVQRARLWETASKEAP